MCNYIEQSSSLNREPSFLSKVLELPKLSVCVLGVDGSNTRKRVNCLDMGVRRSTLGLRPITSMRRCDACHVTHTALVLSLLSDVSCLT